MCFTMPVKKKAKRIRFFSKTCWKIMRLTDDNMLTSILYDRYPNKYYLNQVYEARKVDNTPVDSLNIEFVITEYVVNEGWHSYKSLSESRMPFGYYHTAIPYDNNCVIVKCKIPVGAEYLEHDYTIVSTHIKFSKIRRIKQKRNKFFTLNIY